MKTVVELGHRRYHFRPLVATEVPRVNAMLRAEYGDCYPYPLRAERLMARSVYLVCVNDAGTIVAFAKAEYRARHDFFEVGGLIIDPAHRVAGLGSAIVAACVTEARRRGAVLVFAEPVCYRPDCASQRLFTRQGFRTGAIELFKYPHIQLGYLGDQPETVTVCMQPSEEEPFDRGHRIFVSSDYVPRVEHWLGRSLETDTYVFTAEDALPPVIRHAAVDFEGFIGSTFVDVCVNVPGAVTEIEALRAEGFLLAGVLPGFGRLPDGRAFDYVRLYLPPEKLVPDFERIHVASELSPELADMAREYRARYR